MKAIKKDRKTPILQPLNLDRFAPDKVTATTEFLKENYRLEVNRYDPQQMRIVSLKRRYMYPPTLDDISLHLMEENIPHTQSMIKMILRSPNRTHRYDPLKDYFEGLRGIEVKESQIDRLASYLRLRSFNDRPDEYYAERTRRLLRKWLVGAAACAVHGYANEVALVLVSEQEGIGKTFLARFLCPESLTGIFATSSSDKRAFNFPEALTTNFLVLADEMQGITTFTAETFKGALSASKLPIRMKGEAYALDRPRIGSVIATTNNRTGNHRGFLHPSMGLRRFICIDLDDIDRSYAEDIDVDELWAEALQLTEHPDYDYRLTQDDYRDMDEVNQRYVIDTPASALIQQVFTVPDPNDPEAVWMTPTEVMEELRKRRLIRADIAKHVAPWHVGGALRNLGFTRKMIYDNAARLYKYSVKFCDESIRNTHIHTKLYI